MSNSARAALLLFFLATPASSLFASALTFDQPSPDSQTFITATLYPSVSCSPKWPIVTVTGSKIVVELQYNPGLCIASFVAPPMKANIGTLRGGVYDVVGINIASQDIHEKLVVRDVDPMRAIPPGGKTTGGNDVQLSFDNFMPPGGTMRVTIDGNDAPVTSGSYTYLVCTAPPHAAGDADIVVTHQHDGETDTYTMRAAYRYFDAAAPPDPFLFEPVLFPVAFEGSGAYGSEWTTENWIGLQWRTPPGIVEFWKPPCSTCPSRFDSRLAGWVPSMRLDKATSPSGQLLYLFRGTSNSLRAWSRIHDLSRQAQSAGVEVPPVFERDFKPVIDLMNVPTDSRFRVMLRVWSLNGVPATSYVAGLRGAKNLSIPLTFSAPTTEALAFASADLTPLLQQFPPASLAGVQIARDENSRFWAMVTITNNETQEVTIITPH